MSQEQPADAYEEFADSPPPADGLARLSALAEELVEAERKVIEAEEGLKKAQEVVRGLSEKTIPELMEKLGIETFTTTSGLKVKVKDALRVSTKKENRDEALDWLEDNGHGALVKRKIAVEFGREPEEQKKAAALRKWLATKKFVTLEERKVEPSTLKAFIARELEAGHEVPLDVFGAVQLKETKVDTDTKEEVFKGESRRAAR